MVIGQVDQPVTFYDTRWPPRTHDFMVLKTHEVNLDIITDQFSDHNLFFVCSERRSIGHQFDAKYRDWSNVAIFDYTDLTGPLIDIVDNIYGRLEPMMLSVPLSPWLGYERAEAMNARYAEIAHLPFSYVDSFYQIHGSHRGRLRGSNRNVEQ